MTWPLNGDPVGRISPPEAGRRGRRSPVGVYLVNVLERPEDRDDAREWLAEIATAVPDTLGIADELDARAADGISLHLIETSYAADVAQLTWRPNQPEPEGAE